VNRSYLDANFDPFKSFDWNFAREWQQINLFLNILNNIFLLNAIVDPPMADDPDIHLFLEGLVLLAFFIRQRVGDHAPKLLLNTRQFPHDIPY
jgi:hypothetical protein